MYIEKDIIYMITLHCKKTNVIKGTSDSNFSFMSCKKNKFTKHYERKIDLSEEWRQFLR